MLNSYNLPTLAVFMYGTCYMYVLRLGLNIGLALSPALRRGIKYFQGVGSSVRSVAMRCCA